MRFTYNRLSILIIFPLMVILLTTGSPRKTNKAVAATTVEQLISISSQPGGGEISPVSAGAEWQPAEEPWSKERMLGAAPYPLGVETSSSKQASELIQSSGDPGMIPSSAPQGSEFSSPIEGSADFFASTAILAESFPYVYVPPYTSYQNFDFYTRFPYSTVGVLFFSQGGADYQCTAASIGHDAVWTAGRCIHSGDGSAQGWSSDVVFVPAYKDGNEPYGQWSAYNLWTKGQWYAAADPSFDMGGVKLNRNSSGKEISEVVGNLGFSFNLSEYQAWFTIGYPDQPPFDGQWQYICAASYAYSDTSQNAPNPIAMGCDMNGGAAGSPWIRVFSGSTGPVNFLNGNSSYQAAGEPEAMYSPYFGSAAKSLFEKLLANNYLPLISKD